MASAEMEQELVGLFGGGLAVVAASPSTVDVVGHDAALHRLQPARGRSSATITALAPLALGEGDA